MPLTDALATANNKLAAETEHCHQLTAQLLDYQLRYRLIGEATEDAVWDWNLRSGEVDRNHVASTLFGCTNSAADRSIEWWKDNIHPDDRTKVLDAFALAIESGQKSISAEYRFRKSDGNFADISDRGYFIFDASRNAVRAVGVMIDMTELERTKERLRQAEDKLIHLSRQNAMGTMASVIAHELNQPLAAIANYVRAGRRLAAAALSNAPPNFDLALEAAEQNALRAGQVVQRLRDLVKSRGVDRRTERLGALIHDANLIALVDAESAGVTCHVEPGIEGFTVTADRIQIQQVIINLVRNAMEALLTTDHRDIFISAREVDGLVEISVRDNGPGIPIDRRAGVFSDLMTTKATGMGIGLSICRTIIEAHGGKIWLADSLEPGTDFRFTLPAAARLDA
ncbi:MAG: hypothetical protein JWM33_999 [Caulobacteraceae bacterium]|nr:hypothetical protein [Caulobacteraceae bacterium]